MEFVDLIIHDPVNFALFVLSRDPSCPINPIMSKIIPSCPINYYAVLYIPFFMNSAPRRLVDCCINVYIGSCTLHTTHNAFRVGLAAVPHWEIDEFVADT